MFENYGKKWNQGQTASQIEKKKARKRTKQSARYTSTLQAPEVAFGDTKAHLRSMTTHLCGEVYINASLDAFMTVRTTVDLELLGRTIIDLVAAD